MARGLTKVIEDLRLDLRMWETWKLKHPNMNLGGHGYTLWSGMSEHDKDFNLAWNELRALVRTMTLPTLKKLLELAKEL